MAIEPSGGAGSLSDGSVTVTAPSGLLAASDTLVIEVLPVTTTAYASASSKVVSVTLGSGTKTFPEGTGLSLSFVVTQDVLNNLPGFRLAYWNSAGKWEIVDTLTATGASTVTGKTPHLSVFSVVNTNVAVPPAAKPQPPKPKNFKQNWYWGLAVAVGALILLLNIVVVAILRARRAPPLAAKK